jgi:hypothetical protein
MCASGIVVLVPKKIFRFKTRVDNVVKQDDHPLETTTRDYEINKPVHSAEYILTDKLLFE